MNKDEFCRLVNEYKDQLYLTAWAILNNEYDAEDAVGNALLLAYEHLYQLKNPKKFKPWILKITKNEALKLKKKQFSLPGDDIVESMLETSGDDYDEFSDILKRLPEKYRLVIVLFYYDGLSLKDISRVLSVPVGTVKSRLSRGKSMLKNILERGL